MAKKVTIQDIADELHLSRNTISKAINNTGNVAPETKNLISHQIAFSVAKIQTIPDIAGGAQLTYGHFY